MMRLAPVLLLAVLPVSCAPPRFRDQPVVWRVDDARSIREPRSRPSRDLGAPLGASPLHEVALHRAPRVTG